MKTVPDVDEDLAINLEKVFESVEFDKEEKENVEANETSKLCLYRKVSQLVYKHCFSTELAALFAVASVEEEVVFIIFCV